MKLSIIIVNYNVKYFLEQCLYSVLQAGKGMEHEVIVVDNASEDGSLDRLQPLFPSVQFIANKENTGFAKANNQALALAKGEFILFLNPDTILPEDAFEKSIAFMQAHPDAGALGVRMIDGAGNFLKESKRAFPSPATSFFKLSGLTSHFPASRLFGRYYLGHLDEHTTQPVDVLAGAFMLLPRRVTNITAGFDELFFMYAEDVDLSYRVQQAGFVNYYFPEITIVHFKGESTKKGNLQYVRLFYKAMSQFVKKHYGGTKAGLYVFLINLAIWLRAGWAAIGNLFVRKGQQSYPVKNDTTVFVMGTQTDANRVKEIFLHNKITPVITSDEKDMPASIAVLCSNESGFKTAIEALENKWKNHPCFFHRQNSSSMVSSFNKDGTGDCFFA